MSLRQRAPSNETSSTAAYARSRAAATCRRPGHVRALGRRSSAAAVVQRRARMEHERAGPPRPPRSPRSASRGPRPPDSRPAATTTVTAAPGATASSLPARSPRPRPRRPRAGHRRRAGSTDCVSGSPKRQLNSSTRGPSSVSINPGEQQRRRTGCPARPARPAPAGGRGRAAPRPPARRAGHRRV